MLMLTTSRALVLTALLAVPTLALDGQERAARRYSFNDRPVRIGVMVDTRADAKRDQLGAEIEWVTPGGPAEGAGLKAGDIVTNFNGTSLGGVKVENENESGPGQKLIQLARALEPGDTVRLEYRRDQETREATLVAERLGPSFSHFSMPGFRMRDFPHFDFDLEHGRFGLPGIWGGLELVTLNPELGEYFGTRQGVLVVKAPADSTLKLKGGDVILAIDGRAPSSAGHALRILRSYAGGETAKLEVMRQKSKMTVNWKVPERTEHHWTPRQMRSRDERKKVERS